ncbi:MAG: GspH/FimT family pseudopilin [Planctomycetaceae bacterium]
MRTHRIKSTALRQGVSMVEAMVVVLLVSATASTALFKLSSAGSMDPARQSAQSLAETLRTARELAVSQQTAVTVTPDLKSSPARWSIQAAQNANGPAKCWDLALEAAAKVDGTMIPIRFDGAGNASYTGEWKFLGENGYYVRLEPIGARVTMKAID